MTPPKIVALRERDLPAAAAALSRAFQDDPLQKYVLPDPVERAAQSPGLFAPLLRYGLNFGEVLTTEGSPVGAAVWLGPEAWEVTPERATAAGLDKLPAVLGAAAAETILFRAGGNRSLPPSGRSAGTLVCDGGGRRPREARQGDWAGAFTADHRTRGYGWPAVLLGNSATGERRFIRTARVSPSSRYG